MRESVRVERLVNVQRCLLCERFPAGLAYVRPLPRVGAPVLVPRGLRGQATTAYVAGELFHPRVNVPHVPVQTGRRTEALAAHVARARPLPGVSVTMDQKVVRSGQYFPAIVTLIVRGPVHREFRAVQFLPLLQGSFRRRPHALHTFLGGCFQILFPLDLLFTGTIDVTVGGYTFLRISL